MKYLLVYRDKEGDYLISSCSDKEKIVMEYFYYSYRKIRGLVVLETKAIYLPTL